MRTNLAVTSVLMLMSILCFQNCSLGEFKAAQGSLDNYSRVPENGSPGGGAGPVTTLPPAAQCISQPGQAHTIAGLLQTPPALRSQYAIITRFAGVAPFVPPSTSVTVASDAFCYSRNSLLNPGLCPDPNAPQPVCQPRAHMNVTITLKCDANSNTANTCGLFSSRLNQDIDLNDATLGQHITLAVQYSSNLCDTSAMANYFAPFTGTKVGKIRITSSGSLAGGQVFTVQVIGAELIRNGQVAAERIVLNGTYSAEIISLGQCTPR